MKVLSKQEPITRIAQQEQVSRKFLYQQKRIAEGALNHAFDKKESENEVLYYLPVTQQWIFQFILALILICHCSYRGVAELLRDLFDYSLSIGTIHNRIKEATEKARQINQNQDLSPIKVPLLDELFQGSRPVLTGVDSDSTYCFLLEAVEHRDEDTWGWYLLEAEAQGLNPDYTIADAGVGIRAGQKAAWGEKPCHGDVWHILDQSTALCRNLAKKAQGATTQRQKLEEKMEAAKLKGEGNKLSAKLIKARKNEANLLNKFADIKILLYWLRNDILSLAGPDWSERMELMNFMIDELKIRENQAHKGIKSLRIALFNQKENLLAFAQVLDKKLANIAHKFQISLSQVRQVCLLMKKSLSTNVYWQKWNHLYQQLSAKFLPVKEAVESAMKSTPRASSLVENLNSRLRNYFFLRKHLNSDYLDLLRFFLNHRTLMSSRIPERVGKSPTELMTGEKHPHWLSLLGFDLFQRV
ncbi:hypothetical protein [Hyella patelloides]|uniref:hypothetical protein n=1 Tax=Hyella patelloides TaxID=1982969 RepID=UPI001C93CBC1|nr:hypothetical protein [Hyella patelloides]